MVIILPTNAGPLNIAWFDDKQDRRSPHWTTQFMSLNISKIKLSCFYCLSRAYSHVPFARRFVECQPLLQIFVAGNHEMSFRRHSAEAIRRRLRHVTYLQDSEVKVEGLVVYGSPWTFSRYSPAVAFTVAQEKLRPNYWENIPDETDILVTHSPPKDILDFDGRLGCPDLRQEIFGRIRSVIYTVVADLESLQIACFILFCRWAYNALAFGSRVVGSNHGRDDSYYIHVIIQQLSAN